MSANPYSFGRRDGRDPKCCATCALAILHGGHGTHAVRRWCKLRQTWLPFKERDRLRMLGCTGHQRDMESREARDLWERMAPNTDADGWCDQDFERLR